MPVTACRIWRGSFEGRVRQWRLMAPRAEDLPTAMQTLLLAPPRHRLQIPDGSRPGPRLLRCEPSCRCRRSRTDLGVCRRLRRKHATCIAYDPALDQGSHHVRTIAPLHRLEELGRASGLWTEEPVDSKRQRELVRISAHEHFLAQLRRGPDGEW